MKLPVIYVFTHDSVAVGEDGPTHQPVEQLASLRAMPNVLVLRPCDANETADAWCQAVKTNDRPAAMLFSRQKLPILPREQTAGGLSRGAYVLSDCQGAPDMIILASGAEVHQALGAQQILTDKGVAVRVVSMPCWELFEAQDREYRRELLCGELGKRVSIEAGVSFGWDRYLGRGGIAISVNTFGASAPQKAVAEAFGFTVDAILKRLDV